MGEAIISRRCVWNKENYATGTVTMAAYGNTVGIASATVSGLDFSPRVVIVKFPSGATTQLGIGIVDNNGKITVWWVTKNVGLKTYEEDSNYDMSFSDNGFTFRAGVGASYQTKDVTYYAY